MIRAFCLLMAFIGDALSESLPDEILRQLNSDRFVEREEAQENLIIWARESRKARAVELMKLLAGDDPEIQKRLESVLRTLSNEDYLSDGQGYLGIMMEEQGVDDNSGGGIRVTKVMNGGPAELTGIKAGDLILALDGKGFQKQGALEGFMEVIASAKPLSVVRLRIRRGEQLIDVSVELGKRPIPDLRFAQDDPQVLDLRAKEDHFRSWFKDLSGRLN